MAKTLGLHIGDTQEDAELEKKIRARARAHYSNKVSSYLRAAVEKDLAGESADPTAGALEDILVRVTKAVHPSVASSMAEECERLGVHQPRLLAQILFELYLTLDRMGRTNETTDHIRELVTGRGRVLIHLIDRDASRVEWTKRDVVGKDIFKAARSLVAKGHKSFTMEQLHEESDRIQSEQSDPPLFGQKDE